MQAIINGEMYEVEPAVKVIIDELMIENAKLKKENARLENEQGVVELLRDYGIKDISVLKYILDQYQKVIVNITNGRMSYLTYPAETILSVASDIYNEDLEKAINDTVTDGEYQPVKHGHWIEDDEGLYHCSVCKERSGWEKRYCPELRCKNGFKGR